MKPSLFCDWPSDYERQFWAAYPRRIGKLAAMKALAKARENHDVPWAKMIGAVHAYVAHMAGNDPRFIKHPATWIHQGCWDDELPTGPDRPRTFASIAIHGARR